MNKVYISVYVSKAKDNFNNKNYETVSSYLDKVEQYGYNTAKNEIFERIGYVFENDKYNDYFMIKYWYVPNVNVKGDDSELNDIEKANVMLIRRLENK